MVSSRPGSETALDERVPDQVIAGKYRLTRLLGRGGMGSVWEGVHASLGTRVAVKFIDASFAGSADARNRFVNEARATAKLDSKHVVKVFDHGLTEDGRPWIVMEFLQGEPLDRRLARVGRLPPGDTARLIKEVCRALSKAHAVGIVHRDLKPENIFLVWDDDDRADVVKVVDFGIAKFTDGGPGSSSSTRTGAVLGTPYYMSPEQARGLRSLDHRTDLWSVGVITYRCMTGLLPFEGEAVGDLLVKLCTAPLPVPSLMAANMPPGFDAWFTKALSREPAGRFSSAAELADALSVVCSVSSPAAGYENVSRAPAVPAQSTSNTHSISGVRTPPERSSARTLLLAAGTLVLLGGAAAGAWRVFGSPSSENDTLTPEGVASITPGPAAPESSTSLQPARALGSDAPAKSAASEEPAPAAATVTSASTASSAAIPAEQPSGASRPAGPATPRPTPGPRGTKPPTKEPDLGY